MTIDTRASVTIATPNTAVGLGERNLSRPYILHTVSEDSLPTLMQALVELILGQSPLQIWSVIAEITNEFILGLGQERYCYKALR
jgi:hypothetical protein